MQSMEDNHMVMCHCQESVAGLSAEASDRRGGGRV